MNCVLIPSPPPKMYVCPPHTQLATRYSYMQEMPHSKKGSDFKIISTCSVPCSTCFQKLFFRTSAASLSVSTSTDCPFCCSSWGDSIHQGGTIFTGEYCPGGHYSRGDTIHSDTGVGGSGDPQEMVTPGH